MNFFVDSAAKNNLDVMGKLLKKLAVANIWESYLIVN